MLSAPLIRALASDTSAHSSINTPEVSGLFASSAHDLGSVLGPSSPTSLTRHYTSLQEHADQITGTETAGKDEGLTPRQVTRREGFAWGQRPSLEDERRHSRYQMPMEQERQSSPPPLDEIIRRTTIDDADDLQNIKLRHMDSIESHASGVTYPAASISTSVETSDSYVRDNRRSSIAAFAKGIVQHVPNLRMPRPQESKEDQQRRDSGDGASMKLHKKDRVLSFAPLPLVKSKESYEKGSKPSVVIEEPSTPVDTPPTAVNNATTPPNPHSTSKGGLRDRRKVNLDLSMPAQMPDLPARGRLPVDMMGSLGAPRSRSPKTPWVRKEQPQWEPVMMTKSAPILKEDYIRDNTSAPRNDNYGGIGLLPDTNTLFSSQSPKFERPPARVRDRCYISRPKSKRTRSGRSDKSGTSASDSTLARTPDSSWTPAEERIYQEHQTQTRSELRKIASESKASRSRRWYWLGKASSEDAPSSPRPVEPLSRRFSINPFRRSNRISDQTDAEVSSKQQAPSSVHPSRGKHVPPSTSLAHILVPPAFIPPGVQRVPTPPIFDANGEVKGKLANFFFDAQGGGAMNVRTKIKPSPGGYWDSDALLMSLSSDIDNHEDNDEDEGPEGPRSDFVHTPVDFEPNGTPGLTAIVSNVQGNSSSYLSVKPPASPSLAATSPMLGHDGWYRIHQSHFPDTPDERTLTALARQEEEERLRESVDIETWILRAQTLL
ncbi:unnamed protein product [Alternaria alternata]